MPDNEGSIEKELNQVDDSENPHTSEKHGKPKPGREQQQRDNFEKLYGGQGGGSSEEEQEQSQSEEEDD